MEYKKYDYDTYTIHFIKTDKFKSIFVSLVLINEFNKDSLAKNFVLRKLLTLSSKNLKNESEVAKKVYDLYNAGLFIANGVCNNAIYTNFDMETLEDKYTEDGQVQNALNYFFDTIFYPNIVDGKFEKTNFELAIKSAKDYYDREKENKVKYACNRAYSIFDNEYLKYDLNGEKEDLKNITQKNMVEYYNDLFKKSCANIFIIGNFDDEEMLNIINTNVNGKFYKNENKYIDGVYKENSGIKEKEDIENNNQSILVMIYKVLNITKRERNVISPIFNRVFGVGNNSKLFKNIREEKSLCYDIRSIFLREESVLMIRSGINSESKDKVIESIKYELENIQKGNISDKEFDEAIKFRKRSLKQFEDENDSISYIKQADILFGNDDLDKRMKELKTVKKEELIEFAKKIDLSVVYMLKGEKSNEQD